MIFFFMRVLPALLRNVPPHNCLYCSHTLRVERAKSRLMLSQRCPETFVRLEPFRSHPTQYFPTPIQYWKRGSCVCAIEIAHDGVLIVCWCVHVRLRNHRVSFNLGGDFREPHVWHPVNQSLGLELFTVHLGVLSSEIAVSLYLRSELCDRCVPQQAELCRSSMSLVMTNSPNESWRALCFTAIHSVLAGGRPCSSSRTYSRRSR